jgi:hypothetical protein
MPPKFAVGIRACCVAVALSLAAIDAAEQKTSLKGATREQVLARYGEPRSVIVAGNRELLFFATEKITLRDGVVTDVEPLPVETPAPAPAPTAPPAAEAAGNTTPATPAAPAARSGPGTATPAESTPSTSSTSGGTTRTPAPAAEAPTTRLEIKSVRRPDADYARPAPKQKQEGVTPSPATPPPAANQTSVPPATASTTPGATSAPRANAGSVPSSGGSTATPAVNPDIPGSTAAGERAATATPDSAKTDEKATEASDADKKAKAKAKAARRRLDLAEFDEDDPPIFTPTMYVIAGVLVFGAIAYVVWRNRQRQLELAATALSGTPFTAQAATTNAVRFDAALLGKLDWKRFEELVASYYSKTGVIAVRTKTGPSSPVHIKISWKGEPRPFAYVHCIANPRGLIEAAPVQALVASLAAEDIRRGYIITTGKFSVGARDLAEEKSITLLAGDIFLEKLNALPDTARAELMQEVTTGDYTTPSCPVCEAKMTRAPEDPDLWRCASHPDQTIRKPS